VVRKKGKDQVGCQEKEKGRRASFLPVGMIQTVFQREGKRRKGKVVRREKGERDRPPLRCLDRHNQRRKKKRRRTVLLPNPGGRNLNFSLWSIRRGRRGEGENRGAGKKREEGRRSSSSRARSVDEERAGRRTFKNTKKRRKEKSRPLVVLDE